MDGTKKVSECTLDELAQFIDRRIDSKNLENPVTTDQLCKMRNVAKPTLSYYKTLGLKAAGFNRWYLSDYDKWHNEVYCKIINPNRGKKSKANA